MAMQPQGNDKKPQDDKQTLNLTVYNPDLDRTLPDFEARKSEKVKDAATRAAVEMKLSATGNYTFSLGDEGLAQDRTLASYPKVKDGTTLDLVDLGSGVAV